MLFFSLNKLQENWFELWEQLKFEQLRRAWPMMGTFSFLQGQWAKSREKNSENHRSDVIHKITSCTLPILHSFSPTPFQSYTLPILPSSYHTLFLSHTLTMLDSSNCTLFQFYTYPILQSSNLTFFQSETLILLHPSNSTLFESYTYNTLSN